MYYQIRIARQVRTPKSDKNKKTIYLRVFPSWELRKDFILSTKISFESPKWCNKKKQVKGTSYESQRLNHQLNQLEENIYRAFDDYKKTVETPVLGDFRKYVLFKVFGIGDKIKDEIYTNQIFDEYLSIHGSKMGESRKKRYQFVNKRVNEYNLLKYGNERLGLEILNREWYYKFAEFMKTKYNYATDTLTGYLKVLRTAVSDLVKNERLDRNPFTNCKLEYGKSKSRYISENDLQKLINYRSIDTRLQTVADCFVFASQTGLSHSDMRTLTRTMIRKEGDQLVICKKRVKTDVESIIPLNDLAQRILNKYKNDPKLIGSNLLLPVVHLNDFNQLLKRIADQCNLDEKNLSSHKARHAFATTVWLANGGSYEVLQKILGHDNIRTTQIYGKVNASRVMNEAINVLNIASQ